MAHSIFVRCTQGREKIISKHTAQCQFHFPPLIRFDHFSLLNTKMLRCMHMCSRVGIIYIIHFCLPKDSPLFEPFKVCRFKHFYITLVGGAGGQEPTCQCWRHKRHRFDLWAVKIPWNRKWQPTPVFFPGKSHGKKSLGGYSQGYHRVGYN